MKENEIKFYKEKVERFRGTPGQVGYGSARSQKIRFEQICNILAVELFYLQAHYPGKKFSVLDFGCGTGAFMSNIHPSEYFLELKINHNLIDYTGVDAIEENIEDAKKFWRCDTELFPNIKFQHVNADESFPYENYDFIIFSGPFSTTSPNERNALFEKFLQSAKIGVIGNFIRYNLLVDKYEPGCLMVHPSEILRAIDPSEHKFSIKADYMPHDFTVSAIRWEPKL